MFLFSLQEDDQRLKALPVRTVEHILALLPASIGNTPRDQALADARSASELTGADVRMSAASTIANLSQSLTNRYAAFPMPNCILLITIQSHANFIQKSMQLVHYIASMRHAEEHAELKPNLISLGVSSCGGWTACMAFAGILAISSQYSIVHHH